MRLSELQTGQTAVVVKILGHGAFRKRVMEMGFVRGREVKVLLHAPLRDPIKYEVMGYEVSLRRSEARMVEVALEGSSVKLPEFSHDAYCNDETGCLQDVQKHDTPAITGGDRVINVALIGNPNCGKTSLFNNITGRKEHVGNYSGVTVDAQSGTQKYRGYEFVIVDLPGTYSLASYSPEERYVRKYLREETPDVIVNVVDASNLERNLYLTTELIDMGRSMIIDLNMYDELQREGTTLDYTLFGSMIGVPVVPTVSRSGQGMDDLLDTIIDVFEGNDPTVRHIHVNLGADVEKALRVLVDALKAHGDTGHHVSPRYIAIKLLEGDGETERLISTLDGGRNIITLRDRLVQSVEQATGHDVSETVAAEKYGFISGALAETMHKVRGKHKKTVVIDKVITNKYIGYPLFIAVMFLTFWLTFFLGQYPMEWIQSGVDGLSNLVDTTFPDGILKDLVADGIIGGVGGVIVFLPNILILYLCISLMEDTGYMSRAAFIMDKVMHLIGLHGKSFIPMIMGFGCNVPAITATRTIESHSSRLITILINPFMSCSARLPIYILMVGTFFADHAALVLMALYVAGIMVAIITARLLRKVWFKKDETPFVMELPPYRMPTLKGLLMHVWHKGEQYLRKMTGLILVASIVVWTLNYFPRHDETQDTEVPRSAEVSAIDPDHDSYLQMAGKLINPVMEPLGFNWRSTVAALAGVPAKEIVVSTLGVLYTDDEAVSDQTLGERMRETDPETGKPGFDRSSALAFMIFVLLYFPCSATFVAIVKETGDWRYGVFSAVYNTCVAWIAGFIVYSVANLF